MCDTTAGTLTARQRLAGSLVANRLRIVAGDFFTDPLPEDHDVMLSANVCYNFLPERNCDLLARVGSCAPVEVRLLLVDFWTDSPQT